jgi:hypothetical protein
MTMNMMICPQEKISRRKNPQGQMNVNIYESQESFAYFLRTVITLNLTNAIQKIINNFIEDNEYNLKCISP